MSSNPSVSGSHGARVPIPRLHRAVPPPDSSQKSRRRVARACTACRAHKIKCSGHQPQCKHCESTSRECIYIMPRKDRLKIVSDRCVQLAGLLNTVKDKVGEADNVAITNLLTTVEADLSDIITAPSSPLTNPDGDEARESRTIFDGRNVDPREQVETKSLDLLDENLHESNQSRATGFVGKNSEVEWFRALRLQEKSEEEAASSRLPPAARTGPSSTGGTAEQVNSVSFYQDNASIDLDVYVEPYELPAPEVAEHLLAVYMDKVHDNFQILPKKLFQDQCYRYFKTSQEGGTASRLNPKWQAIVNLIFAIGAKYTHVNTGWQANHEDHLIYQARARSFGWNNTTLTQHPDLPQIQVAGLLAFYYLSVGQISRAWVVVGMALRFAQALGLHVRNEDPSASASKREVLVRIWWSLYSLDRHLSVITGRPSIIVDGSCSVPLPIPLPSDEIDDDTDGLRWMSRPDSSGSGSSKGDANSGSFIKAIAQMAIITQSILSGVYSAATMVRTPLAVQQDIIELGRRLDNWVSTLPTDFNFQIERPHAQPFFRERTLLAFQFYSGRILLTRPCLGGLGQQDNDPNEESFLRQMAGICVDAAKAQLDLLPDKPEVVFVFENGPWWTIVHYLMQALAAILLALSYSSLGRSYDSSLAVYAKKTIRWLRTLNDPVASRAYCVAFSSFEMVAKRRSLDISDLWVEHAMAFPSSTGSMAESEGVDLGNFPTMPGGGGVIPASNSFDPFPIDPMMVSPTFPGQPDRSGYGNFGSYEPPT
ncbi:hypothetical protein CC80DRAFT_105298 [Byssothecium circinans]|uniref:Zn(2)-C6 fungal-type domain-containing protein n=1 Tax=Byssothecium circinans TaxID=147558 RepID=A0A6A5UH48_9PLEO|nr:hypothetical protein CC80DRAFT_105298 [Byssothecium circinans]